MEFTWTFWFWIGGLLFLFLPMELFAAVNTPGKTDTFSEFIWWAFGVKHRADVPRVRWARFRRVSLAGMCVGLTTHFVLGWTVLPVILFGAPCGAIMLYAVLIERKGSRLGCWLTDHEWEQQGRIPEATRHCTRCGLQQRWEVPMDLFPGWVKDVCHIKGHIWDQLAPPGERDCSRCGEAMDKDVKHGTR